MRIIAGLLGGRRIRAPAGSTVRPTSDRVREAMFAILGHPAPGIRVLDAFAGSGALGLEALSRGADFVDFIDDSRVALRVLRHNVGTLEVSRRVRIHCADAPSLLERWRARAEPERFRWVFLDPPYHSGLASRVLDILGAGGLLAVDATVVVEHDRRDPPRFRHATLVRTDQRRYGDTVVSFYGLDLSAEIESQP